MPPGLDPRWGKTDPASFLAEVRAFAREAGFAELFASQRTFYERLEATYRSAASSEDFVGWFDGFFGARERARFTLVPAPLHGDNHYGCAATGPDGAEHFVQVLGVGALDATGAPVLGGWFTSLFVHELAHSYCNPLIEAHAQELEAAGGALFAATEPAMRSQAYVSGHIVLCESLVRMTCVLHELERHGEAAAAAELGHQEQSSFLWTGELVAAARRFREKPPESRRFADFMPEIVRAFQDASRRDWSTLAPPFRGPVNAAFTDRYWSRLLLVGPADPLPALERYLAHVFEQLYRKKGSERASAEELTEEMAKGRPLVLYGSPATNPLTKRACEVAGWKVAADSIVVGERRFEGAGLVLIACWPSPFDASMPVVVYTAHDDAALVGASGVFHGPEDWLVARRGGDGKLAPVAKGSFERTLANEWLPLESR